MRVRNAARPRPGVIQTRSVADANWYILSMSAMPDPPQKHDKNPLHGITLERMLNELVEHVGWERMGRRVKIACFTCEPSVSSSLKFLRRTPWARAKVEAMYLDSKARQPRKADRDNTDA